MPVGAGVVGAGVVGAGVVGAGVVGAGVVGAGVVGAGVVGAGVVGAGVVGAGVVGAVWAYTGAARARTIAEAEIRDVIFMIVFFQVMFTCLQRCVAVYVLHNVVLRMR